MELDSLDRELVVADTLNHPILAVGCDGEVGTRFNGRQRVVPGGNKRIGQPGEHPPAVVSDLGDFPVAGLRSRSDGATKGFDYRLVT